jgi:hypothetical protein
MMLADLGAEVIRVERPSAEIDAPAPRDPLLRNRRNIVLDFKKPSAVEVLHRLVEKSDILFEGFRPGVAERLGVGPEQCLARNPRLVYGRMTGWGQDGPLARTAGHDINYVALSGALHLIGPSGGKPIPPLNLVGDFGGGGMMLAFGLLAAHIESTRSGKGQVVDVSMVDGVVALLGLGSVRLVSLLIGPAKTSWEGERRGTTRIRRVTTNMLRWAQSSRSSSCCCLKSLGSTERVGRRSVIRRRTRARAQNGPNCERRSRRCFARARALSGAAFSKGLTRALRRF